MKRLFPQLSLMRFSLATQITLVLGGVSLLFITSVGVTVFLITRDVLSNSTSIPAADIRRIMAAIGLAWLLAVATTLLATRLIALRLTRPWKTLIHIVEEVEKGRYTQVKPVEGPAEANRIIAALRHMGRTIAVSELELQTANAALEARSEELAALSRQIIAVQEEEQRRISREIHDEFGQTLAALKMTLDVAQRLDNLERMGQLLKDAAHIVERAIDEAHAISQNLRPTVLDDLGLDAALEWYVRQFEGRFNIPVDYQSDPQVSLNLSTESEITAYRFVQEALTNVHKHSGASGVEVFLLLQNDYTMLSVKDDGCGFDYWSSNTPTERLHLGLSGLRERLTMIGGKLVIQTAKGEGTHLIALLPKKHD